jgi:chitin disaccharide deacetylase
MRADDMGVALGVNEACVRACKDGIARSVEVIVPDPWFRDAVQRLQAIPEIDVGVHFCLTSEWDRVKWRPLSASPGLADKDGYFHATTRGCLEAKSAPEDIERELRAQDLEPEATPPRIWARRPPLRRSAR